MAVTDVYFVDKDNAGSKPAGCVIYTAQPAEYLKRNDTLQKVIQNTMKEIEILKKKLNKLEQ
jgi:hypothetical protein